MSSSLTDNYSDGEQSKSVLQMSCLTDEWRSHLEAQWLEGALNFYVLLEVHRGAAQPLLFDTAATNAHAGPTGARNV
jgi:hypothetical protein